MSLARHELEQVVCHYGRMDRLAYYTGAKKVPSKVRQAIDRAVKMRRRGVPLGHILGQAPFYGRDFFVTPDTLIPRPETERLVEEALKILETYDRTGSCAGPGPVPEILDLGTGSGCIAASLTLEGPACRMTAIDASKEALTVARKNFRLFGLQKKVRPVFGRFFAPFARRKEIWDLIVSNPPYIPREELKGLPREVRREPRLALDGGREGLESVEHILEEAPKYLKPGGWLLMEIGRGQSKSLAKTWKDRRGYVSMTFEKDLNGIERILIARRNG